MNTKLSQSIHNFMINESGGFFGPSHDISCNLLEHLNSLVIERD